MRLFAAGPVVGPFPRQIQPIGDRGDCKQTSAMPALINLLGWAISGMLGGIMADYMGRKRMMVLAILASGNRVGDVTLRPDWGRLGVGNHWEREIF
jgi:MFS family permease